VKDQVFISYSHEDDTWRVDLETHLKPYLRDGSITTWSDQQIRPGSRWEAAINAALTNTRIAVLLVSADFFSSDFIHENELGPLLKRAEEGGVKILWIPIRHSAYKQTPLKNYQALSNPNKPLAVIPKAKRDKVWVDVCENIHKEVLDITVTPALPARASRGRTQAGK
jgi:internalin A